MSTPIFPTLVGLTYPITRRSVSSTIVLTSANGLETRIANFAYPRYEWDLIITFLDASDGIFQNFFGFCDALAGMFEPFLFRDDWDNTVTGQPISTGDGTTTVFQLVRTFGNSFGAVYAPIAAGMVINLAGTPTSAYTLDISTGLITFTSAPGAGVAITGSYSYYWRCRMLQDNPEFSEFDSGGWEVKKLSWTSCRA